MKIIRLNWMWYFLFKKSIWVIGFTNPKGGHSG